MLAGDHQPRFGEQEVDVGDAAVERIFDRDDRMRGATVLHRVERILECEARQRQPVGEGFLRRDMAIGAGRALKGDRALGIGGGCRGHGGDDRAGGGGEILHRGAR